VIFRDKAILITGGSSGIGRAAALAFAREGARVAVCANMNVKGGEETVDMIKEFGGEAMFVRTDVTQSSQVEGLIDTIVDTYGRLDIANNNAGIEGGFALTADFSEEMWDEVIATNLKGTWLSMKFEIRHMLKQGSGVILNTCAAAAVKPIPFACAYNASKAGIAQLTRTAALEYAASGIRINALAAGGVVNTVMSERISTANPNFRKTNPPIGRRALPEEIAKAVLWLCSDAASFAIGSHVVIDGGYLIS
jgi:NAD(P)-dependent dehydrogenase (short-subunit alcohol dehydrogenase family)